jgi:hypothetical protein
MSINSVRMAARGRIHTIGGGTYLTEDAPPRPALYAKTAPSANSTSGG